MSGADDPQLEDAHAPGKRTLVPLVAEHFADAGAHEIVEATD